MRGLAMPGHRTEGGDSFQERVLAFEKLEAYPSHDASAIGCCATCTGIRSRPVSALPGARSSVIAAVHADVAALERAGLPTVGRRRAHNRRSDQGDIGFGLAQ